MPTIAPYNLTPRQEFKYFFDRPHIKRLLDSKTFRVLMLTGMFGRRFLYQRIERRGYRKVSQPGNYPYAHLKGRGGMKAIRTGLNPDTKQIFIGPILWPKAAKKGPFPLTKAEIKAQGGRNPVVAMSTVAKPIGKTVPQILNEGGAARTEIKMMRKWTGIEETTKSTRYKKRPYRELASPTIVNYMKTKMGTERL